MASVDLEELSRDVPSMLILYVLGKMNEGSLSETQFQKAMFRAMLILGIDPINAGYRPHFYGPYSDLMTEKRQGLTDIGYLENTSAGCRVSEDEREKVSGIHLQGRNVDDEISHMVNYLKDLANDETLLMTYCDDERKTNGRFIDESRVKTDIYRNRIPIAMRLYRNGKVTMGRAAELAGLSVREFQDEMIERYGKAYVDQDP